MTARSSAIPASPAEPSSTGGVAAPRSSDPGEARRVLATASRPSRAARTRTYSACTSATDVCPPGSAHGVFALCSTPATPVWSSSAPVRCKPSCRPSGHTHCIAATEIASRYPCGGSTGHVRSPNMGLVASTRGPSSWRHGRRQSSPTTTSRSSGGLIHSDGCRFIARQRKGKSSWAWTRYEFSSRSEDIKDLFCVSCDALGVRWTRTARDVAVARRAPVARLDEFIGPKS
jgi:hypothetical protein